MDVSQAIIERRSIRAYLPRPVTKETLEEILDKARWAPSGTNTQSWSIEAVYGNAKVKLGEALAKAGQIDPEGRPAIPYPDFDAECAKRRRRVGYAVYASRGIAREDRKARAMWHQHGLNFFGAPVALIIHTPQAFTPYVLQDMGLLEMCIMLLAEERGLGTCPQYAPLHYPDIIKDFLHIPESQVLALGIALGYPDMTDPVNKFPREREPVSRFVRFTEQV